MAEAKGFSLAQARGIVEGSEVKERMKNEVQSVRVLVELLSEAVDREWTSPEEWQGQSAVGEPWFSQVTAWLERYAGRPLWRPVSDGESRAALLDVGRQLRAELELVLTETEPRLAMAVLCGVSAAARRGYERERLAAALGVDVDQVRAWESQGLEEMWQRVSEGRTPLLFAWGQAFGGEVDLSVGTGQVDEQVDLSVGSREVDEPDELAAGTSPSAHQADLLTAARQHPDFDLRQHVSPALELRIRQAYHRHGFENRSLNTNLFAKEERFAVALVGARMELERNGEGEGCES